MQIGVYTDLSKAIYKNWIEQIMKIEDLTELIDDDDEELEPILSPDDLEDAHTTTAAPTTTSSNRPGGYNGVACVGVMNMYSYLLFILISYFGIFIEI